MATAFLTLEKRAGPISADGYERVLAIASTLLFVAALTAIARGWAEWAQVPALIWLHLLSVLLATGLTPVILLRRRGDRRHRLLGQVWALAMLATALLSLGIHESGPARWSPIHLLSLFTLLMVPRLWWTARHHEVAKHRRAVRGFVTGALVIAGFFTCPFGRLLGHWLFA